MQAVDVAACTSHQSFRARIAIEAPSSISASVNDVRSSGLGDARLSGGAHVEGSTRKGPRVAMAQPAVYSNHRLEAMGGRTRFFFPPSARPNLFGDSKRDSVTLETTA